MRDRTATVTSTQSEATAPTPGRTRLSPLIKLTRAHLALQQRPGLAQEASAVLDAVAADLGRQLGAPMSFDARVADATLHPFSHLSRHALYVMVELANGRAVIELDSPAVGALLQHAAGSVDAGALPMRLTRIEEAAFGWLLLSALSTARAQVAFERRFTPRLLGIHSERAAVFAQLDSRQRHLAIELMMRLGDRTGQLRILVPALVLQGLLETVDVGGPGEVAAEVLRAGLDARCLIGSTMLPTGDAWNLVEGDVVVFAGVTAKDGFLRGPGRVVTKTFELRGDFSADGFTLTRATPRGFPLEHAMNDHDPNVPVELEIELTRLRLPLSQLGTLKAGTLLALHVNGAQPVTIRIGDRAVAKAELVDIEGELGARILSLL